MSWTLRSSAIIVGNLPRKISLPHIFPSTPPLQLSGSYFDITIDQKMKKELNLQCSRQHPFKMYQTNTTFWGIFQLQPLVFLQS